MNPWCSDFPEVAVNVLIDLLSIEIQRGSTITAVASI
jgi:hypothetical protein